MAPRVRNDSGRDAEHRVGRVGASAVFDEKLLKNRRRR